ncbi:metal-dependent hydrolase, partial [Staphylococcus aureus]|uniref:metal-dependent hydrolase n=1 Tax=Staphylococcus aureus TaxID=1280 RepID=UPI0016430D50
KTHPSSPILLPPLTTQYFQTHIFSSLTLIILPTLPTLLPHISHTQTNIPTTFNLITFFLTFIFPHPTFTHSILFIPIIPFLFQIIHTPNYCMAPIIIRLVSHVILHIITPKRVKLFYPLPFNLNTPIQFKTRRLLHLSLPTPLILRTL